MKRNCDFCGQLYEAKTQRSKFCSDRCRAAFNMRKKRRKEKKWYNKKTPFWISYALFIALCVAVFFFFMKREDNSRLEKKLNRYQDSVQTLPEKYQGKFDFDSKEAGKERDKRKVKELLE
jgi:predicted nucleic acid-binding Zn ribbon protein